MEKIVVTYSFGHSTIGGIVVENWESALRCIAAWSELDKMVWVRVQRMMIF
jgi:hypothetical protein